MDNASHPLSFRVNRPTFEYVVKLPPTRKNLESSTKRKSRQKAGLRRRAIGKDNKYKIWTKRNIANLRLAAVRKRIETPVEDKEGSTAVIALINCGDHCSELNEHFKGLIDLLVEADIVADCGLISMSVCVQAHQTVYGKELKEGEAQFLVYPCREFAMEVLSDQRLIRI